jgi:hypothetical protein
MPPNLVGALLGYFGTIVGDHMYIWSPNDEQMMSINSNFTHFDPGRVKIQADYVTCSSSMLAAIG